MRPRVRPSLATFVCGASLLLVVVGPALADPDPLNSLVQRSSAFLHREETWGVTLDARRLGNLPEQIRLTVVPQLLGYCHLQELRPSDDYLADVVARADFLVSGLDAFQARNAADGMLALALLRAHELTGDARYRDAARPIVDSCLTSPAYAGRLNRGLMAALALAQHHRLTGDPAALAKARETVELVAREQHADGSFAHFCPATRDLHYTAWMSMELMLLGRLIDHLDIPRVLGRAWAFLQGRVGPDGAIQYEEPLPSGTVLYYYSQPLCPEDYDTRGWTNELGYLALVFDRYQDPRYLAMADRLLALENHGAFPDKWGFPPAPEDPFCAWAWEGRSVIRTSVIFWSLAVLQAERSRPAPVGSTAIAGLDQGAAATQASRVDAGFLRLEPIAPNPSRGGAWIAWRLARPSQIVLDVLDTSGRKVRSLFAGESPAAERRLRWDARDDGGHRVGPGVYFVRLRSQGSASSGRLVLIE